MRSRLRAECCAQSSTTGGPYPCSQSRWISRRDDSRQTGLVAGSLRGAAFPRRTLSIARWTRDFCLASPPRECNQSLVYCLHGLRRMLGDRRCWAPDRITPEHLGALHICQREPNSSGFPGIHALLPHGERLAAACDPSNYSGNWPNTRRAFHHNTAHGLR